jgi:alkylation response protein AidB-like acyl-CoA dehydrogenase
MSVELFPEATEEQCLMADSAIRVMEAEYPLTAVREAVEGAGQPGPRDEKLRRALGGLGCYGLLAAEDDGGGSLSGNGVADAAILAAERGARLQPGPFVATQVVIASLSRAGRAGMGHAGIGPAAVHGDALTALLSGEAAATWAVDGLAGDPRGPRLAVREDGADLVLSGKVSAVQDAGECDWILVSTGSGSTEAGNTVRHFLLERSAAGVSLETADGLDLTRRQFTLLLDDVRVPATAVIDAPGLTDWQLAAAAVLSAAESVGAMDANFALALEYSKARTAFGRPIGSFQGLKHLLASTSLGLEMSKAVVATAASALGAGQPDGVILASIARAFVSEKAVDLTQNCFQVFGGIGFTWEHDQHLYMRRLATEAYLFGSPAWHRKRIWRLSKAEVASA